MSLEVRGIRFVYGLNKSKGKNMIGYITLGTNDLTRGAQFYDALLAEFGAVRFMVGEQYIAWSASPNQPGIALTKPFDGNKATVENGVMVALEVESTERVDSIYKKAIALGAKDEGAAGPRGESFYAGYFRDPDGNKLNVFCITKKC